MKSCYSLSKRLSLKRERIFFHNKHIMLWELMRAKLKSSDYNTVFGMLWSFSVPAVTLGILYLMFRGRFSTGIEHYPLYLLIGIVWLNLFTGATTAILKSFVRNREMLHHSSVPREFIIINEFSVHFYKFIIGLVFCVALSIMSKVFTFKGLLLLLPLLAAYLGLIFGAGCLLLCIYSFVNDTEYLWSIFVQLCFFITPVFFALHSVSQLARQLVLYFNPLTVFMLAARNILMDRGAIDSTVYLVSMGVGCVFFIIGYLIFVQIESMVVERT